jgi:hypothetical protein
VGYQRDSVNFDAVAVGFRRGIASSRAGSTETIVRIATLPRGIDAFVWVISVVTTGFRRACVGLRGVPEGQSVSGENDHARWQNAGHQRVR